MDTWIFLENCAQALFTELLLHMYPQQIIISQIFILTCCGNWFPACWEQLLMIVLGQICYIRKRVEGSIQVLMKLTLLSANAQAQVNATELLQEVSHAAYLKHLQKCNKCSAHENRFSLRFSSLYGPVHGFHVCTGPVWHKFHHIHLRGPQGSCVVIHLSAVQMFAADRVHRSKGGARRLVKGTIRCCPHLNNSP